MRVKAPRSFSLFFFLTLTLALTLNYPSLSLWLSLCFFPHSHSGSHSIKHKIGIQFQLFMYYIYILHSSSSDIYYIGQTDNIDIRIQSHNQSDRNTFTSKHRPWVLVSLFSCGPDRSTAMKLEKFIKRQKSRSFIERLISEDQFDGPLAQLVRVPQLRD